MPGDTADAFSTGQLRVPAGLNAVITIAAGGWDSVALVGGPRPAPPERGADGSMMPSLNGIAARTVVMLFRADFGSTSRNGAAAAPWVGFSRVLEKSGKWCCNRARLVFGL
jgi:hypothetical protein